ncbi:helix-turn-helix domain-containing protein [Brachybacterium alimentarium]|uniref:helix-turn-helix domain-containing protein n=1 Tax=Brachybacterium alimentarium TaxID=47845 RepID=UPI003FD49B6F
MRAAAEDGVGLGSWRREPSTVVYQAGGLPEDVPAVFTIHAETHLAGVPTEWPEHSHPLHELVWVRGGTMSARVGDRMFTVPEGLGLWVPAGAPHSGRLTADVELCDAFFAVETLPPGLEDPMMIRLSPVLESLLLHLARTDLEEAKRERAEAVVLDVLEPSLAPLELRLPRDPRIDVIVRALLEDPADARDVEDWSRATGVSVRTIARTFRRVTGLSFGQWRQALRMHLAVELLSGGAAVQDVSLDVGYAQPSTFISAFSRVMGMTPGAYAAAHRSTGGVAVSP